MKQRTKYSKRFLAVLLAMLMLLAAAQPVSFVAAAAGNDPDPVFGDGVVSAYWDGETIRLEFPRAESNNGTIRYYADLIDLDFIDPTETHLRKVVRAGISLSNEVMTIAENGQISAVIQRDALQGVDVSHRINVAITAVNAAGWRSQPIHAVVGDAVRVPAANATPASGLLWKEFTSFDDDWGNENDANMYGSIEGPGMNFDGVYGPGSNKDRYRDPGYADETSTDKYGSAAYRFYITHPEANDSADIRWEKSSGKNGAWGGPGQQGWDDLYNYIGAKELWLWVDMTNVRFNKLSFQVRPNDGGVLDRKSNVFEATDDSRVVFGKYEYSTVNYYEQTHQEAEIQYVNSDGMWDTLTTVDGYLRDFGNYRGFLRIPVGQLYGQSYNGYYNNQKTTGDPDKDKAFVEDESLSRTEWKPLNQASLRYVNFENDTQGISDALNYITSVGFTWQGATADSKDQPFYIDKIGFVGDTGNITSGNRVGSLPYSTNEQDAFARLIAENLPDHVNAVNLSHRQVISDLMNIAQTSPVTATQQLLDANDRLQTLLKDVGETPLPKWLEQQVASLPEVPEEAALTPLFELYLTFTIDQLEQLGAAAEKRLLEAYNAATEKTYFPDALAHLKFTPFNTFEQKDNYQIGDKSYHMYENTGPNGSSIWQQSPNYTDTQVKNSWESTRKLTAYSLNNTSGNPLLYTFGLGSALIGNNGFMNSQSVDTRLNRGRAVSDTERYRITFPYQGKAASSWDDIASCSINGATDLMFYVDFSDITAVRKLWVSLVGSDGLTYSHDFQSQPLRYERLAVGATQWEPVTVSEGEADDGCLMNEMAGFKGFIKIPLSYFYADTKVPTESPRDDVKRLVTDGTVGIKQMRVQYTATDAGAKQNVGSHLIFDMFGFVGENMAADTFVDQYFSPVETGTFEAETLEAVQNQLNALYTTAQPLDVSQSPVSLLAYDSDATFAFVQAYNSLSIVDKAALNEQNPDKVAQILAVRTNWENRTLNGSTVPGKLKTYVENTNGNTETVKSKFSTKTSLSLDEIGAINTSLNTFDDYPVKYQNIKQTYWADRNLNAVYPNFTITTPSTETAPVAELTLQGDQYTGGVPLSYYCAADAKHSIGLEVPSTATLTAEDGTEETVLVSIANTTVFPTAPGTMQLTLSVKETEVPHAATYTGTFVIKVKTPAPDLQNAQDSNLDQVNDPAQYRMQTYTVHVRLVSDPSYTVVIPADTSIEWFTTSAVPVGEGVQVEDVKIPSSASIQVGVSAEKYAMEKNGNSIPYLLNNGNKALSHTFTLADQTPFQLEILVNHLDSWLKVPYEEGYQDVLNFTINYQEAS
uniref:hypothetical protein n=1 Tax=Candidatus Fimivicinus sp. TaxID=3056640 RepID=UPI003FEE6C0F